MIFLSEMSHLPPQKMVIISSLNRVCSDLGPCFHTAQPAASAESSIQGLPGIYGAGKLSSDRAEIHLKGRQLQQTRSSEKRREENKPQTCLLYKDLVNSLSGQGQIRRAGLSPSTEEEFGDRGQWASTRSWK